MQGVTSGKTAAGQSLQFIWSSGNSSFATVTQNGVAKTMGFGPGQTEIQAAVNRASHNKGSAEIVVLPGKYIKFEGHIGLRKVHPHLKLMPNINASLNILAMDVHIQRRNLVLEAEVGQNLNIATAFYGDRDRRQIPFIKCAQLPYKVGFLENKKVRSNPAHTALCGGIPN